jgi:hypothetical protein
MGIQGLLKRDLFCEKTTYIAGKMRGLWCKWKVKSRTAALGMQVDPNVVFPG